MEVSGRVQSISESITLKLNAKAIKLEEQGKLVYNLTAGQLPYRPLSDFSNLISSELDFLKSYQYSPVAGFPALRDKFIANFEKTRNVNFGQLGLDVDCVVTNGGKHAISNVLGTLINPGDEVILLAPCWVSYQQIIQFCHGVPKIVKSSIFDVFVPSLEDVKKAITEKTRAIIINSPNNPAGIHYSDEWMFAFAELIKEYPDLTIISDEIYYQLSYFDPKPTYFYQHDPSLLKRTIIVDGISKTLASTGLRIGYLIAPTKFCESVAKLQGQTTSGANSLIQRALINFDFDKTEEYLGPIKVHLRENSRIILEVMRDTNLSTSYYQSTSAFYFLLDFSHTPLIEKYKKKKDDKNDYAAEICDALLGELGISIVPGTDFGAPNTARISLVSPKEQFQEAMEKLMKFLSD
ncbi:MAG: aminotransferase class I/II-fold pyridoxal phosphate-dependent enzyme [Bacteriovoracaceae bacterium]|jgi:aspartate aminotransferase|nr:aminotransferase class I/II-fold pyridoxal phosphate-dependent enzyme [Bacteriovoracaceae bacterium]